MTLSWTFVVDGPPVPKARPRMTRTGHVFTPSTTVAFERRVRAAAEAAGVPRLVCGVAIDVVAFCPRVVPARKGTRNVAFKADGDNLLKAVLDALNPIRRKRVEVEPGLAWHDDAQVTDARVRKRRDDARPRLEVTITLDPEGEAFSAPVAKARKPHHRDLLNIPPQREFTIVRNDDEEGRAP